MAEQPKQAIVQAPNPATAGANGKVRFYVSRKLVDVSETVEVEYNGRRVRVLRKYVSNSPPPVV
jgi:hypothetical protein